MRQVIKRDGRLASFDEGKISAAISKALIATQEPVMGINTVPSCVAEVVGSLDFSDPVSIEDIQDAVISVLREHLPRTAEAYANFRNERARAREHDGEQPQHIKVRFHDGTTRGLELEHVRNSCLTAVLGFKDANGDLLYKHTLRNLYDGMPAEDVEKTMLLAAVHLVEVEPEFSYVAAQLRLDRLWERASVVLDTPVSLEIAYRNHFDKFIRFACNAGLLAFAMQTSFDLKRLAEAIRPERDNQFTYLGLQTLADRYLLHKDGVPFEMPQWLWMRVAMGLALSEETNRTEWAIEFYEVISRFDYMPSTPTLFNAGTPRPQMSSCYVTTLDDSLDGIYLGGIHRNAKLQQFAGGVGNDWTNVRAMGARIHSTNGISQGAVPFMKVANDTAVAVNQGSKRKGAVCAYLETWHLDIEEFLELRKNTGDERRRTHDMNTANWVPDLFMLRVEQDAEWTLFSPDDVPGLHDAYGTKFKTLYEEYEDKAASGEIRLFKKVSALALWRKMLTMLFETGHPWIVFKDAHNIRNNQQHCGVIHSSNLCSEISLNTTPDDVATCNLGSINLPAHVDKEGRVDYAKLMKTVNVAMRALDNVVTGNYYPVPEARATNLKHRPVGLGMMGWHDMLLKKRVPYDSEQAEELADGITEALSLYAFYANVELAKERGKYQSFDGSLVSRGLLPIDTVDDVNSSRGHEADEIADIQAEEKTWRMLRKQIKEHGLRNSHVMAIAPTATISNICGVSQSIEPYMAHYAGVKENLSGKFMVSNPYLVCDLKERWLWDAQMIAELKHHDGSVQNIARIPDDLKALYKTAWEIPPERIIECAALRQKWIDQAQSLNLYMREPNGKKLHETYLLAWRSGLKSTYYLRTQSATTVEKHTLNTPQQVCVIGNGTACEACQ